MKKNIKIETFHNEIKVCNELIGKWHDEINFRKILLSFLEHDIKHHETKVYRNILRNIDDTISQSFEESKSKLESIFAN